MTVPHPFRYVALARAAGVLLIFAGFSACGPSRHSYSQTSSHYGYVADGGQRPVYDDVIGSYRDVGDRTATTQMQGPSRGGAYSVRTFRDGEAFAVHTPVRNDGAPGSAQAKRR